MLTESQRLRMMSPPTGPVDLVVDTDAYNEIDDQFAIAYALGVQDRLRVQALYAAPFPMSAPPVPPRAWNAAIRRSFAC